MNMILKTALLKNNFRFISLYFPNRVFNRYVYLSIRILFIIVFYLFLASTSSYSQIKNCQAKIIVEENGNVDSISENGLLYTIILTNTGTTSDRYIITSINVNSNSKNPDNSTTNTNVVLNIIFLDADKNEITEIIVNPGQSISFFSKLTIPVGTDFSKWSSNQIVATSTNCTSYRVDTVLHSYILNPNSN